MRGHLPLHVRTISLLAALAAALLSGRAALAKSGDAAIEIIGLRILGEAEVRTYAGRLPECARLAEWAPGAVRRIVRKVRAKGYSYARGWFRVEDDCRVRIEIDEGRMHRVVFAGATGYRALLLRVDLNLPRDVFHAPTVARALAELKAKHGLLHAYFRVRDTRQPAETSLGEAPPQRVLTVYVVTSESFGWSLNAKLDSTWGLVPTVGVKVPNLLLADDRFHADLGISIPYRKFLFDEEPRAQWVHGQIGVGYRFPAFLDGFLAPGITASTAVSQYHRADLGLARFFLLRTPAAVRVIFLFPPLVTVTLGGGVEYTWTFQGEYTDAASDTGGAATAPGAQTLLRGTGQLDAEILLDREFLRHDQRDLVNVRASYASSGGEDWVVRGELSTALFFHFGLHDLIVRARGFFVLGDVRLWDEEPLAGAYQRVFFGNRYWVRELGQFVAAFRLAVWEDTIKVGVFHDLSLFADRSAGGADFAVADAFGPSLHFLFFDLFALDIYYGFGFDPLGFDHNLSFTLETVF